MYLLFPFQNYNNNNNFGLHVSYKQFILGTKGANEQCCITLCNASGI